MGRRDEKVRGFLSYALLRGAHQATRRQISSHQRPTCKRKTLSELRCRQHRCRVIEYGTAVDARRVASDSPQPILPRFAWTMEQRILGEIADRLNRAVLGDQRRA